MKATELRIGNWVKRDSQPDGFVIDARSIELCEMRPQEYEPIPLTAEWLERFGFEDVYSNKNLYSLSIISGGFAQIVSVGNTSGEISVALNIGSNDFSDFEASINLHHIHQLQNLYYSLTGKELEIKETAHK